MNATKRLLAAVVFLAGSGVWAGDNDDSDRLKDLREELGLKRSAYEKIGEKEQDQLSRLRYLEEQIALSGQLVLKIERTIRELRETIEIRERDLDEANLTAETKKQTLYTRLRYVYMTRARSGWLNVLLYDKPSEMLSAMKSTKTILEYDRHLARSYRDLSENITENIARLKSDKDRLDILKTDYENELSMRKSTLDTRRKLLDKLRKDKSVLADAMDRLEEDSKSISGIFDDIESERNKGGEDKEYGGLDEKKGDLIWPVYGPIVRSFGTKKDKRGIKLTNPGIDIKAPYGSKVVASASGRVIYVSWLRGYGQFVIMGHGLGYYTLYANLESILVDTGDEIRAGQTIALVGDSGTLEGSRLHFELRHEKNQLDPTEWLR